MDEGLYLCVPENVSGVHKVVIPGVRAASTHQITPICPDVIIKPGRCFLINILDFVPLTLDQLWDLLVDFSAVLLLS